MKIHPLTVVLVGGMVAMIVWLLLPARNKTLVVPLVPAVVPSEVSVVEPSAGAAGTSNAFVAEFAARTVTTDQSPQANNNESKTVAKTQVLPASDPADDLIKIGRLWSAKGPLALGAILPYLTNSNPDVRALAIEAVKQVGDHSTAALLQTMAAVTEDEEQRTALEAAATFLATPTLAEVQKNLPDQPRRPLAANVSPPTTLPPENQPIPDPNAGADRN